METTGRVVVEKVMGKSTATRCFSKYPLKLILPTKVGSSKTDVVWIYSLSYGGGIVSGDSVICSVTVEEDCTVAFTTQASTKVYKALNSKSCEQVMEAKIGRNALLAVIPDPVTCFASARYIQRQIFTVSPDSSLVVIDWFTSGRLESGEKWNFDLYKSTNNIFLDCGQPLFLDSVYGADTIGTRIYHKHCRKHVQLSSDCNGHTISPRLKCVQHQVQDEVKKMMAGLYQTPRKKIAPSLVASCSHFGPKATGLVVRIAASTTESVYDFLRVNLASLEPVLGVAPYS